MPTAIDLQELLRRESEQVEWKDQVADPADLVATLCAFANDLANLGGGYVVCGAREGKDEHGFPVVSETGLSAARLREIEGRVLDICRKDVTPPLTPQTAILPCTSPERQILVFIQPASSQAHLFRRGNHGAVHYIRVGRATQEARNGRLRELLVRRGAQEPWDRRPCSGATVHDLDLLTLRDTLTRLDPVLAERGVEHYLSDTAQLSPFVPPLCHREPLTGTLRPRNFAMLLFGRETQRFVPGAVAFCSTYPGTDRSTSHAARHELAGNLIAQTRRLHELLERESYTIFDKENRQQPNATKYPIRALYEALGNALVHRDYELVDPTRVTIFSDRVEFLSPGALPLGVSLAELRAGQATAKWRNQALAWFFNRLQWAQAEGQGIPTILKAMRDAGCPEPVLEANEARVLCILPAHPRHEVVGAPR